MPEKINWSFSIEAALGPRLSGSDTLDVDAYDKVSVKLDAGASSFALDGPIVLIGTGAVRLLADAPQTLRITNGTNADVTVKVLVGRSSLP